jgi:hypothetical protein
LTFEQVLRETVHILEGVGIRYMLDGGIAVNCLGLVRTTQDIDVVVESDPVQITRLAQAFSDAGFQIELSDVERLSGISNIIHVYDPDALFRIDLWLARDPDEEQALGRRERLPLLVPEGAWVVRAEDLIVRKLRIGRERDLDDIRGILRRQAGSLDDDYLDHGAAKAGQSARLKKLREDIAGS